MNSEQFQYEYDLKKFQQIIPKNRDFKMLVAPRYLYHFLHNAFEDFTADLILNHSKDGTLFIDIGAHYGFYSLLVATKHKNSKIIAFEPVPENYEILKRNVELNNLKNVEIHNIAVSNMNEKKEFSIAEASDSCGFYQHPSAQTINKIEVETVTLDKFIKDIPQVPVIIKIDTEGHEICVFEGMKNFLRYTKGVKLILEFNPKILTRAGYRPEKLLEEVNQFGFDIYFINDKQRESYKLNNNTPQEWHNYLSEEGYLNIFCSKKQHALSICFFSHSAQLFGAERSMLELVTELIRDYGVMCSVILPYDGPLRKKLEQAGASTLIVEYNWWCDSRMPDEEKMSRRFKNYFGTTLWKIEEKVEKMNPDVIFTNTLVIPWGAITATLLNKPHVWFVREFGRLDHDFNFYLPFQKVLRIIKESSNLIFTNSNAIRTFLFGKKFKRNILTLDQYVNISPDALLEDNENYFERKAATKLVIAGRISPSKGQEDAILAVKKLVSRKRDVELIIVGSADHQYLRNLRNFVEDDKLEKFVRFVDFKENVYPLINQADIVLICSRKEAFGRLTLEAMLLKKPVIGTRSGGTPELIREGFNGLLYEVGDWGQLAEKIEFLIDNKEKIRELGENGFKFAKENFAKEKYGGRVYELLKKLKGKKNPASLTHMQFILEGMLVTLADSNREITEKNLRIMELETSLKDSETEAESLRQTLRDSDDQLSKMINQKDAQISNLECLVKHRESSLNDIYNSHGWKALLRYYKLRNLIFPPLSTRRKVAKLTFGKLLHLFLTRHGTEQWVQPLEVEQLQGKAGIKISVIIVHYGKERLTIDCVKSLLSCNYPSDRYEIILINNGTNDSYQLLFAKFHSYSNIHLLNPGKNLGFGGGCNVGIQASHGEYILLLNNDTIVPKDFLADYVASADSYSEFAIIGTKIRLAGQNKLINSAGSFLTSRGDSGDIGYTERDIGQYDYMREVFSICGANMLIRREVFDTIGFLDNRFFLYYEDADFCYRARLHGFKILYLPEPSIIHHHAASSGEWTPLFTFYVFRNKLFLHIKNSSILFLTKVFAHYLLQAAKEIVIARKNKKIHLQVMGSLMKNLPYLFSSRLKSRLFVKKVRDHVIFNYIEKIFQKKKNYNAVKNIVIYNRYLDTLGGGELSMAYLAKGLSHIFKNAKIHIVTFDRDINVWGSIKVKSREDIERAFTIKLCDRIVVQRINTLSENRIKRGEEHRTSPEIAKKSLPRIHLSSLNRKLKKRIKKADLFVNHSFLDELIPKSKKSIYLCMFPHFPHKKNFMKHYSKVVGISEFTVRHINQRWNCKAELLYPFALDVAPPYHDFSQRENIILNIGRFFAEGHSKRQDIIIKAFKWLQDKRSIDGWKLILIGRCAKKDEGFLEKMKEDANGYDITFLPELSEDKKIDLMKKAKIFVHVTGYGISEENLPEYTEHFGISVVEAKIHGLVPLVINKGGLKELVTHGKDGLIFDDVEGLVEQLTQCAENENLLKTMSTNAYHSSTQKFNYKTYLDRLGMIL